MKADLRLSPRRWPQPVEARVRPRILMIGMHLTRTRGGISTLISGILNSSVAQQFSITYIETQAEDFGKIRKMALALAAGFRFICNSITTSYELTYVHLGSNASLYRESMYIALARILRQRVVVHFHAGDMDHYYSRQPRLGQRFISWSLKRCTDFIAVSEASATRLRKHAPNAAITVIPNAIKTSSFSDRKQLRFKARGEPVRVLFVGAMGKLKGERDLIEALAMVDCDSTALSVSLLGYGSDGIRDLCTRSGVGQLIDHLGPVPASEGIKYFERADIFVLPTYAEAMPISVIEAMAAGLPVITTKVGGIPELIEHGVDGFLVEPGDIKSIAATIETLINDKHLRRQVGLRAQDKARKQMDISSFEEKLSSYLAEQCCKGAGA
ncbi:MAG: glycosyltransferase family 4 protein [Pyrinomonadaceae bacterium]